MQAPDGESGALVVATVGRRLLCLIYEVLILAAVLLAGTLPIVLMTRQWDPLLSRTLLQLWLMVLCGGFYVWQWTRSGQTLPMKTWRLQLLTVEGKPLNVMRAIARYLAALLSVATLGLGFLWALVDRNRQFLHDRLAGTKVVVTAP